MTANVAGEIINVYTVSSSPRADSIQVAVASDSTLKVTFVATATAPPATASISVTDNTFVPDEVLLATGGTAADTVELVHRQGGVVAGFGFVCELDFLPGRDTLHAVTSADTPVHSLVHIG